MGTCSRFLYLSWCGGALVMMQQADEATREKKS
jgi:hypothetical protein